MTRYSASRGILYTAPPGPDESETADAPSAAEAADDDAAPAPADD